MTTHVQKRPLNRRVARAIRRRRRRVPSSGWRRAQDLALIVMALGVLVLAYAAMGG